VLSIIIGEEGNVVSLPPNFDGKTIGTYSWKRVAQ